MWSEAAVAHQDDVRLGEDRDYRDYRDYRDCFQCVLSGRRIRSRPAIHGPATQFAVAVPSLRSSLLPEARTAAW